MRRDRLRGVLALAAASATVSTACAAGEREGDASTVDVYAAASLTAVFTTLAANFESSHPGIDIALTYGGSSDLATQIAEGAPADVFASANESQMERVREDLDGDVAFFAVNMLTIAVPEGNPAHVTDFASLAQPGLVLVTCAPQVPCGAATAQLEGRLGVELQPASEEASVTDVLGKVASGEADAGLVYVTDIARTSGVEEVPFAGSELAANRYPIAVVAQGDAGAAAREFVDYVLGPAGQRTLASAGFGAP